MVQPDSSRVTIGALCEAHRIPGNAVADGINAAYHETAAALV